MGNVVGKAVMTNLADLTHAAALFVGRKIARAACGGSDMCIRANQWGLRPRPDRPIPRALTTATLLPANDELPPAPVGVAVFGRGRLRALLQSVEFPNSFFEVGALRDRA